MCVRVCACVCACVWKAAGRARARGRQWGEKKSCRVLPYVNLHLFVEAVVEEEIVRHSNAVRLHRVP